MALGLEPSRKNFVSAKKKSPKIKFLHQAWENYKSPIFFDVITAVMVFNHISEVGQAFKKAYSALKKQGELIIVSPDFEYFKRSRHYYKIKIIPIDRNQYTAGTIRDSGLIADIIRTQALYIKSAGSAGFKILEEVEILPTGSFIKKSPWRAKFREQPVARLLRFIKK